MIIVEEKHCQHLHFNLRACVFACRQDNVYFHVINVQQRHAISTTDLH